MNLSDAHFWGSDLRDANLRGAKLRGSSTLDADFGGADLRGTDLRGDDLRFAKNLTEGQLGTANGDSTTFVPFGMKSPAGWGH